MSQFKVGYVCAKHGIPFKYMTIAGGEIPYCEFCTETQLEKKRFIKNNSNPEIARNIAHDRSAILSEKAIWKGKERLSLKKRPKIKKYSTNINIILNKERKARLKSKGWMGKP